MQKVKTGLLVVTNPRCIENILETIEQRVSKTLYIQLLSAALNTDPVFGTSYAHLLTSPHKYTRTIRDMYAEAALHCRTLDVRILLSGLKYHYLSTVDTRQPVDLVVFDRRHSDDDIAQFVRQRICSISDDYKVLTMVNAGDALPPRLPETVDDKVYLHAAVGGTFDRIHIAHKWLLSQAVLRAENTVTVGVTADNMLKNKVLSDMIESTEKRLENVNDFLQDVCSELQYNILPITDPYGPAITDATMDVIVVSRETDKGARKINEIRRENQLAELDILSIHLIEEPHIEDYQYIREENKISSSTTRLRLLGTLLNPIDAVKCKRLPIRPYIIGLTGGIASGKSGIAKYLLKHNAAIISCDLIGHTIYRNGSACYQAVVDHFGHANIVDDSGEIDRKRLGAIVFNDPDQLTKLNSLVWPAIGLEVRKCIGNCSRNGDAVVVVEAAILAQAGWDQMCHEIWTAIVPRDEAVARLITRNKLTEQQARARIDSQPDNRAYVTNANVVFCTLWEPDYTKRQVDKAWGLLQERLKIQS